MGDCTHAQLLEAGLQVELQGVRVGQVRPVPLVPVSAQDTHFFDCHVQCFTAMNGSLLQKPQHTNLSDQYSMLPLLHSQGMQQLQVPMFMLKPEGPSRSISGG
jgi:hypothetical protein